jgi:hypothetical protein
MSKVLYKIPLFFCLIFLNVRAQTGLKKDSLVSDYIRKLSSIWAENSNQSFNSYLYSSNDALSQIPYFFNFKDEAFNETFQKKIMAQQKILAQEQLIYKKDKGFNLIAGYQYNFSPPIVDPEEMVVFRQRFQAGIEWDIFRSGFYESKAKIKQLKYKQQALNYQRSKAFSSLVLKNNYNMIIYLLNEEKIEILTARKAFVESFKDITAQLLSLNQITKENYIKVAQHLNDINYQINLYKRYNDLYTKFKTNKPQKATLPVFDINYEKVAEKIINTPVIDSADYYNMLAANDQNYFLKEMSLKPNLKYNFYDVYNTTSNNRTFLSAGLNLSVPLAMNHNLKKQRDVMIAELQAITKSHFGMDTQNVVLNSLYEFSYKQKQYSNLLQKRQMFEELLRNEKVKQQYGSVEFNPLTANIVLDDYWSITIELLDLKQDMYRILNDLKLNLPTVDLSEIIKPYVYDPMILDPAKESIKNNFKNINAVYLWSDVFKNHSTGEVVNYCKLNNFNTLVISGGKNNLQSVNSILDLNLNLNCELMISNNKLVTEGPITTLLDSLSRSVNLTRVNAIHLDIEPHTFSDFKTRKEEYFEKYIALINSTYDFTQKNKIKLCVSIPLNYPENVLSVLFEKCDHVYLMAYENVKPSFITEKIKEELALNKDKVVLALRTNDFSNKAQMDALFLSLGVKNTAYHDLDELIKMSKKNVNKEGGK